MNNAPIYNVAIDQWKLRWVGLNFENSRWRRQQVETLVGLEHQSNGMVDFEVRLDLEYVDQKHWIFNYFGYRNQPSSSEFSAF